MFNIIKKLQSNTTVRSLDSTTLKLLMQISLSFNIKAGMINLYKLFAQLQKKKLRRLQERRIEKIKEKTRRKEDKKYKNAEQIEGHVLHKQKNET